MNGIELARVHYETSVRPGLGARPHSAALLGPGSEVLGFDDEVSADHDFGPRVQIFEGDAAGEWFTATLGFDPAAGVSVADWLLTPSQLLASVTRGAVFRDDGGELARRREALAWYPDDVWRYVLAAGWLRYAQEEPFVARAGATGDELGSRIVAARLTRELVRLAFLVERAWAPYGKWLGRAFTELKLSAQLTPLLVEGDGWRDREDRLVAAAEIVAVATNALGLGEPVDPSPRAFFTRDIRVLEADRFTTALCAPIIDPRLRGLLERFGVRHGRIPRIPGTVDQVVDCTDLLGDPPRFRAAAPLLGL